MHENFDINFKKKYTSNAVKCQKRYSKWVIKLNNSKLIFQYKSENHLHSKHTHHNEVIAYFMFFR